MAGRQGQGEPGEMGWASEGVSRCKPCGLAGERGEGVGMAAAATTWLGRVEEREGGEGEGEGDDTSLLGWAAGKKGGEGKEATTGPLGGFQPEGERGKGKGFDFFFFCNSKSDLNLNSIFEWFCTQSNF